MIWNIPFERARAPTTHRPHNAPIPGVSQSATPGDPGAPSFRVRRLNNGWERSTKPHRLVRAAEDRIEIDERFREQCEIKIAYRQML